MWHGTSSFDPKIIINSQDGFNTQYANDDCMWGRAVYFAANAAYSCGAVGSNGYAHHLPNGATLSDGSKVPNGTNVVIFSKVQVGKKHICAADKTLKNPPDGFDSI